MPYLILFLKRGGLRRQPFADAVFAAQVFFVNNGIIVVCTLLSSQE